jgi:hypothetical protein
MNAEEPRRRGRWKPGESGNPAGRAKGAKNRPKASTPALPDLLREVAAREGEAILNALIVAMRGGDARAAAALLGAIRAQAPP